MRLCVVRLAPGHGSSTTIAGAIALPGYEISYAAEGWGVQPATMAAYPASLKDLTAINKLREEEREATRNRK